MKHGQDFLSLYLEFCAPYEHLVEARRSYVPGVGEEQQLTDLPPLAWHGAPVELFIYDLGHEYYLIKEAWDIFSPSFIPGRTTVVINPYGKTRTEELRRFYREHARQLKPIHKPASSTKGFLFVG
jgi:hypothetical protein